ncbi:sigma-E factor regulatory protein RseB domain-containing protein [Kribbella deserti]|uniref:Sigma-E factor regulatory protein RseB domain-containing protein n=1 Tax=Kribbella deserti TaxID=1926257 RepID=A0ABV6QWW0_9ACTN
MATSTKSLQRVAVLVGTALLSFGLPVPHAQAESPPPADRADSPSAITWLERAASAPDRVSFHATQQVTSWGPQGASSAVLDVVHAAQQGSQITVLGTGESDGVKAFIQRTEHSLGPTVDGGPLSLLQATYQLVLAGETSTIGRSAVLVEARRDDQTLAARFWIDKVTGLLLQRQLFTVDGTKVVRATVFTALDVGPKQEFISHLPPMLPEGGESALGKHEAGRLRSEGWNCADQLPASLRLYDVHTDQASGSIQFAYSDGLFNVSVFEQRGALDPAALTGYTAATTHEGAPVYLRYGMPSYAVWESNGIVYTLVGDIPFDVMDQVVAAFPHELPEQPRALDRMGKGLAKMALWLTPMGALSSKLG